MLIKCACYAHAIEVVKEDHGVELCMWTVGHDPECRTLRDRIRWAWHELIGKKGWTDECILDADGAEKLARILLQYSDELKGTK